MIEKIARQAPAVFAAVLAAGVINILGQHASVQNPGGLAISFFLALLIIGWRR